MGSMVSDPTQSPVDYGVPQPAPRTNGLAIAATVLGIVGVLSSWLLLPSILALVFGLVSHSQIQRSGGIQGGRGLAITGIVLGAVGLLVGLIWLLVFISFGGVRRQPALRCERRLGDAHEYRPGRRRLAALGDHPGVGELERLAVDQVPGKELGVARLDDGALPQHLPHDELDLLVVDGHTLGLVDLLHLLHQVELHRPDAGDLQDVVGIDRSLRDLVAWLDDVAIVHPQALAPGHGVLLLTAVLTEDLDDLLGLGLLDLHPAGDLRDGRPALGAAGLEELDNTRQAVGDVLTGDASRVEGPHGELGTGLADRLGGDDADRLADVHLVARGHVAPVAGLADAVLGVAGQHGPDPDLVHAGRRELALDDPVDEAP